MTPPRPSPARRRVSSLALFGLALSCTAEPFDYLQANAPVSTRAVEFPLDPRAEVAVAATALPSEDGRGLVVFADADGLGLGYAQLSLSGGLTLRYASPEELTELRADAASDALMVPPVHTGLAAVADTNIPEGLLRVHAPAEALGLPALPDRLVRFRVLDFSRPAEAEDDMQLYPWVLEAVPALSPSFVGGLGALELDGPESALPEALAVTASGELVIWDGLGSARADYLGAREALLAADPTVFDADPSEGFGLTLCPGLPASAIAGGALPLPGTGETARLAALLLDTRVVFVGREPGEDASTLVGAPRYACALGELELPGSGATLLVADVDGDGDDDLAVGAPASAALWLYRSEPGEALPSAPEVFEIGDDADAGLEFGASLDAVTLGATDHPHVLAVGAPGARVGGKAEVGRVYVFDAETRELVRTIEDLAPRTSARHGLGVHGMRVPAIPGREELIVVGARELRAHWTIAEGDLAPD